MPPKDLTPEERLFKLIQEGEKPAESQPAAPASSKPVFTLESRKPAPAEESFPDRQMREKKAVRAASAAPRQPGTTANSMARFLSLNMLNRVFAGVLIASAAYFVWNHGFMRRSPNEDFLRKAETAPVAPIPMPRSLFEINAASVTVPERDIFRPYRAPEPKSSEQAAPAAGAPPSAGERLMAALVNFKLTGIFVDEDPEALVETKDENRTYALRQGTEFRGLMVKAVKPEGVVFSDGVAEQLLK